MCGGESADEINMMGDLLFNCILCLRTGHEFSSVHLCFV